MFASSFLVDISQISENKILSQTLYVCFYKNEYLNDLGNGSVLFYELGIVDCWSPSL